MSIENLARREIRELRAYETAVRADGAIRLHANEASWSRDAGASSLNRYPELRPTELQARMAEQFGVSKDNLLVTRGSSEAIDLLIRTFCRAGKDNVVIASPTFVMYKGFAEIQGADVIDCRLLAENDFALDADSVENACSANSKLVFLCSPNSPTGNVVPAADIIRLLEAREDKSIIVVDEAYIEFSDTDSMAGLVDRYDNLVVLRTLSKALALAGARCGAVIGGPVLIRILNGVLAPYALATPVVECVLRAMSSDEAADNQERIRETIQERERVAENLKTIPAVKKLWPSQANFLLVQFYDLAKAQERLQAERILIRDISGDPRLENFARISIGSRDENDRLLAALRG
jgi:histidinol-phosphate aminotransferase